MPSVNKIKLGTPWKNRVAFVHDTNMMALSLLVHPCGELLIISNDDRCRGAASWGNALILWSERDEQYWICKYGLHDTKFPLAGMSKTELAILAIEMGIDFRPKGGRPIDTPRILDSSMAKHLFRWSIKHPRMAKDNPTVSYYVGQMKKVGITPIEEDEYTGF
jgi:hypothetical protein